MQQRYYDPLVGRFLSIDPVEPSRASGANFNRFSYANNSPYRYLDPDGRYSCDSARVCRVVKDGLKEMDKSARALDKTSPERAKQVRDAISEIGTKNDGKGPNYISGILSGNALARTDQKGTTKLDLVRIGAVTGKNEIPKALTHEATHDFDTRQNGAAFDKATFTRTETAAYKAEQSVAAGLGETITDAQIQGAIEDSVKNDLRSILPAQEIP